MRGGFVRLRRTPLTRRWRRPLPQGERRDWAGAGRPVPLPARGERGSCLRRNDERGDRPRGSTRLTMRGGVRPAAPDTPHPPLLRRPLPQGERRDWGDSQGSNPPLRSRPRGERGSPGSQERATGDGGGHGVRFAGTRAITPTAGTPLSRSTDVARAAPLDKGSPRPRMGSGAWFDRLTRSGEWGRERGSHKRAHHERDGVGNLFDRLTTMSRGPGVGSVVHRLIGSTTDAKRDGVGSVVTRHPPGRADGASGAHKGRPYSRDDGGPSTSSG